MILTIDIVGHRGDMMRLRPAANGAQHYRNRAMAQAINFTASRYYAIYRLINIEKCHYKCRQPVHFSIIMRLGLLETGAGDDATLSPSRALISM